MLALPRARVYGSAGVLSAAIAGRVRALARRLQNDAGWFPWRGVSDFGAVGYLLTGREADLVARLDRYAACGRTVVRVLGMLGDPSWVLRNLACSPRAPGYWDALDRVGALVNARGMYVNFGIFADAQIVVPDAGERREWMYRFGAFLRDRPGFIPQCANEPWKNGWDASTDGALLALADVLGSELGHHDFSIGDPQEGVEDVGAAFETLARHSSILVIHPDRDSHGQEAVRWRRWVDHLEGFTELPPVSNRDAALVLDEPNGASRSYQDGRRENDPDAFVAGQVAAACAGFGFTYHWIPEEPNQWPVDELPGLTPDVAAILAQIPCSPDWQYKNDSWPGAPTDGIAWTGKTGKLRHLVNGDRAWSVAYGEANFDSVRWRPGWTPREVYAGPRVRVWAVNQ